MEVQYKPSSNVYAKAMGQHLLAGQLLVSRYLMLTSKRVVVPSLWVAILYVDDCKLLHIDMKNGGTGVDVLVLGT